MGDSGGVGAVLCAMYEGFGVKKCTMRCVLYTVYCVQCIVFHSGTVGKCQNGTMCRRIRHERAVWGG